MPDEIINSAEFENQIRDLKQRGELDMFIARQVYELNKKYALCIAQIDGHETKLANIRKAPAVYGAATGGATAIIIGVIEWFISRFGSR